jgi:hypothetical protein
MYENKGGRQQNTVDETVAGAILGSYSLLGVRDTARFQEMQDTLKMCMKTKEGVSRTGWMDRGWRHFGFLCDAPKRGALVWSRESAAGTRESRICYERRPLIAVLKSALELGLFPPGL